MSDNQTQINETIATLKRMGEKADDVIDRYLIKGAKVLQDEAKSNLNDIQYILHYFKFIFEG